MPSNVYECMLLLDTNKVAGDVAAAGKKVVALLEKHGAEVLASRPWAERRLAYPIMNHNNGIYYLLYFRLWDEKSRNLTEIERDLGLRELILRALEQTGGNRTHAAKLLDLSHRALLYKIRDYQLGED